MVNWGDGSGDTTVSAAAAGSPGAQSHTYADDGNYTVTVTVTEDNGAGASDSASFQVQVNNVAPVVTSAGNQTANEGTSTSLSLGSFSDPGDDSPWQVVVNWGDGSGNTSFSAGAAGSLGSQNHTYADNGNYMVTVTVTEEGGTGAVGSNTFQVQVDNVAPVVTALGLSSASISENDTVTLSGSFSDPGALDTHTVVIQWGDGTMSTVPLTLGDRTFAVAHQYMDDNPTGTASDAYTISVSVTDKDSGTGGATTGITVNNVAPTISSGGATPDVLAINTSTSVAVNFGDPGTLDTYNCVFKWGDGPLETPVGRPAGSTSCSASHTYTAAGVYTVEVSVTDDDGGSASTAYRYVVVYDPNGGFVTGGGWINSPAGALVGSNLTGKANFGFVSKYKKGSSVPDGETQFQLHFATFNFHSTSYQWLVVAGAKAQYKGEGILNGKFGSNNTSGYGFMITATDGDVNGGGGVDKFRIKIWDKATADTIVYDNVLGASDDINFANPQALGGGSIQINGGAKK